MSEQPFQIKLLENMGHVLCNVMMQTHRHERAWNSQYQRPVATVALQNGLQENHLMDHLQTNKILLAVDL